MRTTSFGWFHCPGVFKPGERRCFSCKTHHRQDFAVPPWTRGIVEWWSSPWLGECSFSLLHTWMTGSQNAGIWQPASITTKRAQRQWSTRAFLLEVFLMHILYHNWNTFHITCKNKLTALCYILQRALSEFCLQNLISLLPLT